jgi:hypothetical protein
MEQPINGRSGGKGLVRIPERRGRIPLNSLAWLYFPQNPIIFLFRLDHIIQAVPDVCPQGQ